MEFSFLTDPHAPCFLIAEIGVNHNGSVELAKQLIDQAKAAGADAVKFQTFTAASLVTKTTPKVKYQLETTSHDESHFDMIKKLELGKDEHKKLFAYCKKVGIEFMSTPYDIGSAKFLNELGVRIFKTASADIVDIPLHEYLAGTGKPVIIATGMATVGEIEEVVKIYRAGGSSQIVLLHCVSNYPCADESLNMRTLVEIFPKLSRVYGYSDHSPGPFAAVVSIAYGAKVIEKHFTSDRDLPGPDHRASADPAEFAELVKAVRRAEKMLGKGVKELQEEEQGMALTSRKSLVLTRDLHEGHVLSAADLTQKRPGSGISPGQKQQLIGKKLRCSLAADHILSWSDLEED